MDAAIFHIQKFSLNDGPGIRTVVFFKGCPLRCGWCANPESQAFAISPGLSDPALGGQKRSIEELVRICLQDQPFYEESSGGVTLSGGEPLAQPEAALALLTALHREGVHTVLETTGFAKNEVFQLVTKEADALLFDMKHWDKEKHRLGTGVENGQILKNMAWAIARGQDVLPRIPVIPGYNDSLEDAAGFCTQLREVGAKRAQLLPFHQFGENKYRLLGREYRFSGVSALHPEDLEPYLQAFLSQGIEAFF